MPGSVPIGPSWPGGGYEGVVGIRADLITASPALAAAAATLPGEQPAVVGLVGVEDPHHVGVIDPRDRADPATVHAASSIRSPRAGIAGATSGLTG